MNTEIFVVKSSGEKEPFSESKVLHSIKRVGLPEELHKEVLNHVKETLRPDITTAEIFTHITEFLEQKDKVANLRFNLKQAILDLGPTGFPFEKYINRIFKDLGYETQVDITLNGQCVKHEIDLLIEKNGKREIIEAKFHNHPGTKTEIHVLLYTYARFLDVKDGNEIDGVWVVTNTKLSEDAITYSKCKGIRVIAWNYPEIGNLQDFVGHPHMYPITILKDLNDHDKQILLENDIVLCCDLLTISEEDLKSKLSLDPEKLKRAKESAKIICKGSDDLKAKQ